MRVPFNDAEGNLLQALEHVRRHNGFLTAEAAGAESTIWLQTANTARNEDGVELTSLAANNGPEDERRLEELGWQPELDDPPLAEGPRHFVRRDRIATSADDLRPLAKELIATMTSVYGWPDASDLVLRVDDSEVNFPVRPGRLLTEDEKKSKKRRELLVGLIWGGPLILILLGRFGIVPGELIWWALLYLAIFSVLERVIDRRAAPVGSWWTQAENVVSSAIGALLLTYGAYRYVQEAQRDFVPMLVVGFLILLIFGGFNDRVFNEFGWIALGACLISRSTFCSQRIWFRVTNGTYGASWQADGRSS